MANATVKCVSEAASVRLYRFPATIHNSASGTHCPTKRMCCRTFEALKCPNPCHPTVGSNAERDLDAAQKNSRVLKYPNTLFVTKYVFVSHSRTFLPRSPVTISEILLEDELDPRAKVTSKIPETQTGKEGREDFRKGTRAKEYFSVPRNGRDHLLQFKRVASNFTVSLLTTAIFLLRTI